MKKDWLFEDIRLGLESGGDPDDLEMDIWDKYGDTLAVMTVDSTGFSRTTKQKGVFHFLSIILEMRSVGEAVFKKHGAINWRMEADNLFAEFRTVDDALSAAFDMHEKIKAGSFPLHEGDMFGVCIGIGYGWVLRSEHEGVFGDEMNLCAKLGEDIAEGGETLMTESAMANLKSHRRVNSDRKLVNISGVDIPYFSVRPKEAA